MSELLQTLAEEAKVLLERFSLLNSDDRSTTTLNSLSKVVDQLGELKDKWASQLDEGLRRPAEDKTAAQTTIDQQAIDTQLAQDALARDQASFDGKKQRFAEEMAQLKADQQELNEARAQLHAYMEQWAMQFKALQKEVLDKVEQIGINSKTLLHEAVANGQQLAGHNPETSDRDSRFR
ncbi:hypothetical protein PG988_013562 [Apiospora saccharicola]